MIKVFKVLHAFLSLIFLFFNLKNKKILFFGAHFHRVLQKEKYFNRFYDSILEHHGLENMVYIAEYQRVYSNNFNQKAIISLASQLNNYKLLNKFKKGVKINEASIFLEDYDTFFKDIKNLKLDTKTSGLNEAEIIVWTQKIIKLQGFFSHFYQKVKPEKVVFFCYYGYEDLYAALTTANQMNIKTIDFQHGPQTNVHMAYSNWLKVPENGFNTMPKEFWNWDNNSKENIDKWAFKIKSISAKVVGQPFLAYCEKKLKYQVLIQKSFCIVCKPLL